MNKGKQENNSIKAALDESEKRLKAIFDAAVDGIITINKKGIIEMMNPAALNIFQYDESEVLGNNIKILMPEPDHSAHDGYLGNYHNTGERKIIGIGRNVIGKKKDGTTFPFRLSISEVKLDSGTIYSGVVHDMTEEMKAKKELELLNHSLEDMIGQRTQELEKINNSLTQEIDKRKLKEKEVRMLLEKEVELGELKSRFVSMASHEFRTPLTGIQSASSLIDRYEKTDQVGDRKRLTDMIRTSVGNLTSILNDFLSIDKLQSGKVETHEIDFLIDDLCAECIEELEPLMTDGKHIESSCIGDNCSVYLDRNIVKNVMINLLSNGLKYSKSNGQVSLSVIKSYDSLKIEVKDNGIGIPEADQPQLFGRFFRAHNVTNIKGTGLGLNIVKRYLQLMKGEISFTSKEGVGTTFTCTIPLTESKK
ncbi:MAG: two-component system sensor kinase FixL [Parvicellaceae bacterium]|jgi:two-component system sensor kinase FixL